VQLRGAPGIVDEREGKRVVGRQLLRECARVGRDPLLHGAGSLGRELPDADRTRVGQLFQQAVDGVASTGE
jgi:hypothetical protein